MRKALITLISQRTMQETLQSRERSKEREPYRDEEDPQSQRVEVEMNSSFPRKISRSRKSLTELVQDIKSSPNNSIQHGLARLQKVSCDQSFPIPPSKEPRKKSKSKSKSRERRGKSGERVLSNERRHRSQEKMFKKGLGRLRKTFQKGR